MNKETQKKKVLEWLDRHGSITTFEAVTELHIYVNGTRYGIYELLEEGDGVCLAN